jgi:putative endonuclease
MYILECADKSYYTGSTKYLELRVLQHQAGEGANHTKKRLPVKLVYFEEFDRIDAAFFREKQVQGWSRRKKEALIRGEYEKLPMLSRNYTQLPSTSSGNETSSGNTTSSGNETLSLNLKPEVDPVLSLPIRWLSLPKPRHLCWSESFKRSRRCFFRLIL